MITMSTKDDEPPRILILEDEGLIALDLEAIVQGLGFNVLGPVSHLEPALEIIEREPLDGAVLDIHLNGDSTSYPVAAALEGRRIPFIFVTGVDKGGMASLFPSAAVVRKPFSTDGVRSALKRMLAQG
jgi:CheY-like chemotaxis protein